MEKLTIKEKQDIIIKYFYNEEHGIIDMSGLDFEGKDINLGSLKARNIYNAYQKAQAITNAFQKASAFINNNFQESPMILNDDQNQNNNNEK